MKRPVAVLNIGGVANVTWIGRDGDLIAFDTGPGNALIDDWMMRHTKVPCDTDGAAAARGRVDGGVLRMLLAHSYFGRPPPKSLDRGAFTLELLDGLAVDDGAATLTAFTVEAIARARELMPEQPALWIVCGGGRRNRAIMSALAGRVENAVVPAEAAGFDGDAIEAEAWAYLAVRSLKGLPITFPGTTGAPAPTTGGVVAMAGMSVRSRWRVRMRSFLFSQSDRSRSTRSTYAGSGARPNRPRLKLAAARTVSNASIASSCGTRPICARAAR